MKKYVIIGNGTAAAACIEGIRANDKTGEITVISEEERPVYCRPLISYLLEGKTDIERMQYRDAGFYRDNGCKVMYGESAAAIDEKKKTVSLASGAAIKYDKLCVAAGSSPFVPPIEGISSVGEKFSFMTLDDALALEKAVKPESRVLIIGAGLIGLKCAEGLHGRASSITVCDLADRILSSILDFECAAAVQKHIENNGINFMLCDSVAKSGKNYAIMKSGKKVEFDILVTAVGVRPNISLIKNIGGVCGRAITVDCRMRTSLPDIYAAGDCTESMDISSDTVKVMALMPNAYMQGRCAGENMSGGDAEFDNAIPMNSISVFGYHIMTAGSCSENAEVYDESKNENIKKLFVSDERLKGFVLTGNVAGAGIYTNMIRSRIPVASVDFEILKKSADLFPFGEKYRRKTLGGVV